MSGQTGTIISKSEAPGPVRALMDALDDGIDYLISESSRSDPEGTIATALAQSIWFRGVIHALLRDEDQAVAVV